MAAKTKEYNAANIFSRGVLVSLRSRLWGATGKLEKSQFDLVDETIDKNSVHASMDLLKDKTLITAMRQVRGAAQRFIKANSLPFPEVGMDFIPKDSIEYVAERLDKYREEYIGYGNELVEKLKDLEEEFAREHPGVYNPARYPSKAYLSSIINFEYVFRIFAAPDKELGVISPDMYKKEMKKFQSDIELMKSNTIDIICKEIQNRITQLSEQCDSGRVSQATLNSFETLMNKFDKVWSGFVNEKDIKKIMEDLKLYLDDTDSKMLKFDSDFRSMVGCKAKEISKTLESKGFKRSLDI